MVFAIALVFILMDNRVADEGVPVEDHQQHQQEEAGQVKQDVVHPPAQDALVDPELVDEPGELVMTSLMVARMLRTRLQSAIMR